MSDSKMDILAIHQTNIFSPHKLGVSCIASSPGKLHLAARRAYLNIKDINGPFSQIDFYDINTRAKPGYLQTIIELEDITGISWLDEKHLITVSTQATINIYNIKTGTKVKTFTTDYGPIACMRHSYKDDLVVTGTEYGYAIVYKISAKDLRIECVGKMVKLTDPVRAVDFSLRPRKNPPKKTTSKPYVPTKRKRSDSSDESEDDELEADAEEESNGEFLALNDLTIYGAYLDKVVAWDYHRTAIIDTLVVGNKVTSVLVLNSGNIAVADAAGYLGVIDPNTFTCRQSDRLLDTGILTIATNSKNSRIIAAGEDAMIAVLEIDKSNETEDVYILREKIKDHLQSITCSLFASKKEFFTASHDNQIIKFRLSHTSEGRQKLKRYHIMPLYKNKLHFNNHETMAIFGKSLQIFKFDSCVHTNPEAPSRTSLPEPQRICTVRAGAYVHSAALDDKWVCYATAAGVKIIDRPNLSRVDTTASKLSAAHIMRLCDSGRFLVIGQQRKLSVIDLSDLSDLEAEKDLDQNASSIDEGVEISTKPKVREHKSIFEMKLKGVIRNILYYKSTNKLVVSCGTDYHFIYIFEFPSTESTDNKKRTGNILLKTGIRARIAHMARNGCPSDPDDSSLYLYTSKDQLIKCDISSTTLKRDLNEKVNQQERIKGLPRGIDIQGLIALSSDQFLINDDIYMFKVDLKTNEIVNSTQDYTKILALNNSIFNQQREVLVVSMT